LEEYFVVYSSADGGEEIELVPNGKEIRICDSNKEEYIKLM